ncbi:MAG TPA: mechanosensitive ion channel domain-containing protein [Steroidobacteraceae bacterium]
MIQKITAAVLVLLLLLSGILWFRTVPPTAKTLRRDQVALAAAELVDESTYTIADRLSRLATTPEEQTYAASALRVADHALDLAFTTELSEVEAHPPTLNAEAAKIQERMRRSQALLDADQQRVADLTRQLGEAKGSQKDAVQDELDLAQSQLELDKDELDEANQDLTDAGGNPRQQIEALVAEHNALVKTESGHAAPPAQVGAFDNGSLGKIRDWLKVRQKDQELLDAQVSASQKVSELGQRRAKLALTLETTKGGISELAQHTKNAKNDAVAAAAPKMQHSHEDATSLLTQTRQITADQKILTLLDRRITDQRQLAGIYGQWAAAVHAEAQLLAHDLLLNALIVILILLGLIIVDKWLQRLLNNPKLDRRQVETLRTITRVSLRVVAVVVILLIAIGMPSQFGTMIGIVGAGLTVALKDFIVAFFGWLMLMGRNGIRLGDWVEINGVSGEVTELGMFHTVLLETGNWSDSGHPTGRRVTFTNSFAIEGHYFNFSTSGQWLWDQLQVVVPAGQDPYPIVDAITKQVTEVTQESSHQAEQEWSRAVPAGRGKVFSGQPGVNVKPVVGGVEISVRYLTRANERYMLRAKLYHAAVDLLGKAAPPHG